MTLGRRVVFSLSALLIGTTLLAQSGRDAAKVAGRVFSELGDPVPEASVYFELLDRPAVGNPATVQADQTGRYEVTLREGGRYSVHAFKPEAGYPDIIFAFNLAPNQILRQVSVKQGDNLSDVDVRLGPKSATLHLSTVDEQTSQTVPYVDYRLCQVRNPLYCINNRSPGEFDFVVPPTEISIEASAQGYNRVTSVENSELAVKVDPGERKSILIKLRRKH